MVFEKLEGSLGGKNNHYKAIAREAHDFFLNEIEDTISTVQTNLRSIQEGETIQCFGSPLAIQKSR